MQQQQKVNKNQSSEKVQVILRIRPLLISEQPQEFVTVNSQEKPTINPNLTRNIQTITLNKPGNSSYMKFAHVSNGKTTQQHLFSKVQDTVRGLLNGIDGTIFAYGQTGAGKTFTMIGQCPEDTSNFMENRYTVTNQNRGILPRSLELIMDESRKIKGSRITVSFYQIYNDKIFDLLSSSFKPLELRENKPGDISIPGLLTIQITNLNEAINHLATGIKNRVTSSTQGNIKSSRSHSIFQINYSRKTKSNNQSHISQTNTLRIVDLAGSEKFNIPHDLSSNQKQLRIQQLKSINLSLSKLGHCISALTSQNRTHVPFRQSKLTRILSDSLLGSAQIRLFICVSPSVSAQNQTLSTLAFANQVKKATFERPILYSDKKRYVDYEEHKMILEELQRQRKAREELEKVFRMSQGQKSFTDYELVKDNDHLKEEVNHLKQLLKVYTNSTKNQALNINTNTHTHTYTQNLTKSKQKVKKALYPIIKKPKFGQKNFKQQFLTPPKTTSANSIYQIQNRSLQSFLQSGSPLRNNKKSKSPVKKESSRVMKQLRFQQKIHAFMSKSSEKDREIDEKIKKKLDEIKKEISTHISIKKPNLQSQIYIDCDNYTQLWKK